MTRSSRGGAGARPTSEAGVASLRATRADSQRPSDQEQGRGEGQPPALDLLLRLSKSPLIADRAFANGALRLRYAQLPAERALTAAAYAQARLNAGLFHPERLAVREATISGASLRATLDALPPSDRDTWVEELLDLAHPPLEETTLPWGLTPFIPSGVDEILFAIDQSQLGPRDTFVDVGSGNGKVVLLAHLLTGARAHGIELDETLVHEAEAAAEALQLEGVTFDARDARTAEFPDARVFYLYSPFSGVVLDEVMAKLERVARRRPVVVCCSPIDEQKVSWLKAQPGQRSWCVAHRSG